MTNTDPKPVAKKSGWRWPIIIVGMLATHVTIMAVAVTLATRDAGFSVVPNYYNRATHWDADQAARKASADLGWQVKIEPSQLVDPLGNRQVHITLVDAAGTPIRGGKLEIEYFHHAHGHEERVITLTGDETAGVDRAVPMRYEGIWEFHCTATVDGKPFVQSSTQWITNAKPPT